MSSTPLPLALTLSNDYPEVEEALRINTPYGQIVRNPARGEEGTFYEESILAADSNFFSFFDFELAVGDPATALKGMNKVVLSPEAAVTLFGDESPLGKTLLVGDDKIPVEVTGVTTHQNEHMHFHFDYLLSIYTNPAIKNFEWSWIWTQVVTYVKLKPGIAGSSLSNKLKDIAPRYAAPTFARFGMEYNDFVKDKAGWNFYLQPLDQIYLYSSEIGNRIGSVGDIKYVYIFGAVGIFVMSLAIINFINLSTARGATRMKEVGVKKTLGAARNSLIIQFQLESVFLTLLATVVGLALMELLRLYIAYLLNIQLPVIWDNSSMGLIPVFSILIGMLAGSYPAFYLTRFKPANVLKGRAFGLGKSTFRNGLIVFQFVISIGFISSTLIVYKQLDYFNSADLGFDNDNVLIINHAEKLGNNLHAFSESIKTFAHVSSVSIATDIPGGGTYEDIFMKEGDDTKFPISHMKIDAHYFSTLGIDFVAGRNYEADNMQPSDGVIINETTSHLLGWSPAEAIGKRIIYVGDDIGSREVLGVVKDYHFQSLKTNIAPLIFYTENSSMWGSMRVVSVKLSAKDLKPLIEQLKSAWKAHANDAPFEYFMLKDEWTNKYVEEKNLGGLFALFAALSIAIAMIGVLGLVTYSSEQRKKEIGIRKVMGASVLNLMYLLNARITRLILIAFLLAVPLSWYAMREWLSQFPYKIVIGGDVFLIAGMMMVTAVWLTVSYQSLKTALTNPKDVLADE